MRSLDISTASSAIVLVHDTTTEDAESIPFLNRKHALGRPHEPGGASTSSLARTEAEFVRIQPRCCS